jgi:uncharacterized membrane protein
MAQKRCLIALIICGIIGGAMIITLGIVTKFVFIAELSHTLSDVCFLEQCTSTFIEGRRHSSPRYDLSFVLVLNLNGTNYTRQIQSYTREGGFCFNNEIECFYDDRDIANSLSSGMSYPTSIFAVVFLSLYTTVMVIGFLLIMTCACENSKETEQSEKTSTELSDVIKVPK